MSPDSATTAAERLLIVSPVYNEAGHLERTAQAIAAQERRPDRWVIVDDGSSDDTLEIARRWERELDFVTVLSAPQHEGDTGPDRLALAKEARAFNLGLRAGRLARVHPHRQARRRRRAPAAVVRDAARALPRRSRRSGSPAGA